MLYTTYLANIRNIPNEPNTICILITRWKPRNTINAKKYNFNILWNPILSPSEILLTRYKSKNIEWKDYRNIYIEETKNNKLFKKALDEIKQYIDNNKNVYLVCYEKDDTHCHRSILREIFSQNSISCKEFNLGDLNERN